MNKAENSINKLISFLFWRPEFAEDLLSKEGNKILKAILAMDVDLTDPVSLDILEILIEYRQVGQQIVRKLVKTEYTTRFTHAVLDLISEIEEMLKQ